MKFTRLTNNGNILTDQGLKVNPKFPVPKKKHKDKNKNKNKKSTRVIGIDKLCGVRRKIIICLILEKVLGRKVLAKEYIDVIGKINKYIGQESMVTFIDLVKNSPKEQNDITEQIKQERINWKTVYGVENEITNLLTKMK